MPSPGVTSRGVASRATSKGITPSSSLVRTHAPVPNPPLGSAFAPPRGLHRLLPAPAGSGTFPTLSPQSLHRRLDPYPGVPFWCSHPFLPRRQRPRILGNALGTPKYPCNAASTGNRFRGCSHSLMFRLPCSLGLPAAPTAESKDPGRPGPLHHAEPGSLPPRAVASLRVRSGQLTRLDFHQLDCGLVGCSSRVRF